MSKTRMPFVQTRRDAWVEINLGHIEHNINEFLKLLKPNVKILAVIKADAYGHNSTMVAPTLVASGVNMLGVASVDEGIELRNSGIEIPILVLGTVPTWAIASAVENDIELAIFSEEHIKACKNHFNHTGEKPKVHIKIDTGMHRIGVQPEGARAFIEEVLNTEEIDLKGVFSHLACAEDRELTKEQLNKFEKATNNLDLPCLHILNTAGILSYPDEQHNMVRAGIGIYGLMPDLPKNEENSKVNLKPVMSLKGRVVHLKEIDENLGVSYGYTYKTDKPSKIATVPIGYADGVPRSLSNKIYGLIQGKKVKQIGNITMDQMMFDVSNIDKINVGDVITLIGKDDKETISINEWANLLGTINYELTCRLKVRLPRVYSR